jgi:hypothetical protein
MRRRLGLDRRRLPASPTGTGYFKNDPRLGNWPLAPRRPWPIPSGASKSIATIYNRLGNLLGELAERSNVELAAVLAVWSVANRGKQPKLRAIRPGEPQSAVRRYRYLGYPSQSAMSRAFRGSLRAQVLGFFDLCLHYPAPQAGDLLVYLRQRRWRDFARYYFPNREIIATVRQLRTAYERASKLVAKRTTVAA